MVYLEVLFAYFVAKHGKVKDKDVDWDQHPVCLLVTGYCHQFAL